MYLSPNTVKTYWQRLYEKLGASGRASAVAEAIRRGLLNEQQGRRGSRRGGRAGVLRLTLVVVIFVSEQLVDDQAGLRTATVLRRVGGRGRDMGVAGRSLRSPLAASAMPAPRSLARVQPGFDILFLVGLAYTSGGAFSDCARRFSWSHSRPHSASDLDLTASWSLLAVAAFTLQAVLAGGHPAGGAEQLAAG